ncbi:uncharacterized protein LOC107427308 [Ziziphus jujuba]|uniref:Uncharacterized protein LOC107427308 n=1 Tax=Ziziphus jujuba TaxID=326968 RepID=A0A6P4AAC4_ZIZJJ|nr:uncharacterized protein LOC107427308 [Ziziphus jujuba]
METQKLTDYERKRLENIRRNDEMVAALKLQAMATQLSASTKRQSNRAATKSYKTSPQKKPKIETPIVMRRSLRTRGMPPEAKGLDDDLVESVAKIHKPLTPAKPGASRVWGPLNMEEAYTGSGSDRELIETLVGIGKNSGVDTSVGVEFGSVKVCKDEISGNLVKREGNDGGSCLKLSSLTLNPENIARVMPGRIMAVRFLPCNNSRMIVAGNKLGNIVFWNLDSKGEGEDGIYLYHPHPGPISGISVHQHCLSKIFTSCYEGVIRLMDAEKEVFDLVYSCEDTIFSLSQQPNNANCLYFCEGYGGLSIFDRRTGNCPTKWSLHDARINTIDFNPGNPNIMATSSTDGTACIWDLRSINADKPKALKTVSHKRAIHSAYFSPYGRSLATTSYDDNVGITSGVNFEETSMIHHYNQTGRWISTFRAIWGWDESYVFIGNMKRGVDIISPVQRRSVFTLHSPHMSAIPCRFDAHPYNVGMLAGATSGGQVYVWTLLQGS